MRRSSAKTARNDRISSCELTAAHPRTQIRPTDQCEPNSSDAVFCSTLRPAGLASNTAMTPMASTPTASLKSRLKTSTTAATASASPIRLRATVRPVSLAWLAALSSDAPLAFESEPAASATAGAASAHAAAIQPQSILFTALPSALLSWSDSRYLPAPVRLGQGDLIGEREDIVRRVGRAHGGEHGVGRL